MKNLITFVSFVPFFVSAQNRNNVWELGYSLYSAPKSEMRYFDETMNTFEVSRTMTFFITNAGISDTSGNLLFYSNGITISNKNNDTLQNSTNFNPGWATDFNDPFGMSNCQGILILPDPGISTRYYVFHESGESIFSYGASEVQPLGLSYSVIDMNLDNGLGGIVDTLKNKNIINDTLLWGGLTAIKHANGRDWWVIAHRFHTSKYYKLLLTPQGIQGIYEQIIGSDSMNDIGVQATFSPDGSKYCISNYGGWFDYMNFDRCSGEFTDPIQVFSPDSFFYGSSFSPNSRFIFASSLLNLYQYDTWNPDMGTYPIHIAEWDSFVNPYFDIAVLFFMHQLAPDGKIYVSPWNGVEYLNVINSPDSLGLSCNFSPHSFILTQNAFTNNIPSFPNYDLGRLEGSLCDTIEETSSDFVAAENSRFAITPNPAAKRINIVYEIKDDAFLTLFDINGKIVATTNLFHYFKNRLVDVSYLVSGIYLATVTQKGKIIWSEKVVVAH